MRRIVTASNGDFCAWLDEAIRLVPEGDFEQNFFRSTLYHSLVSAYHKAPREPVSAVVLQTVERFRLDYPKFAPRFRSKLLRLEWPMNGKAEAAERLQAASLAFLKLR